MAVATQTQLVITRLFDAPRGAVWKAWTDPEAMKRWWGPKGFTAPVSEIDLKVGGKYLSCMRGPDGKDYWSTGKYLEIIPGERLVLSDSFADEKGNAVPATQYGMSSEMPLELRITVSLSDYEGRTEMTLVHEGLPAGEEGEQANAGWNESFDKLADYLHAQRGG